MILRRSVEGSLFALLILSLEVSNAFICHPRSKGHHHHTSPQEGVGRGRIMMVTPSMFTTPPPPSSPPAIEQSAIKPVSSKPSTGLSNLLEGDQVPTYAPTEEEKDPFSALIAASSLDMDIPVWRPTLIQSVLVFVGVPALFFAGLKVFGNKGKPQGSLAHQEAIDKMSTPEILVKLYKDIEDEFQTPQSLERTTPDSFSGAKDSEAQKSFLKPKAQIEEEALLVDRPPAATVDEEHKENELNVAKEASTTAEKRREDEEAEKEAAAVAVAAAAAAAKILKEEQEAKALGAKRIADEEARAKLEKQKKEKEAAAEKDAAKAAAAAAAAKAKEEEEQTAKQRKAEAEVKRKEIEAKQKLEAEASAKKRKDEAAERARIEEAKKAIKAEIDAKAKAAAAAKEKPDAEAAAAAEKKKSSTKAASSKAGKAAGGVKSPTAAVDDSDTKPKQPAAPAAASSEDKAPPKKKSSSKADDDDEWAEMRRLQKESDELLGMSAILGSPGKPPKDRMPPAPEAEFVKRGRGGTQSTSPSPTGVTQPSRGGKKMSKAASKAAAEAERKELLQGLDAVMVDLQQRADEKRGVAIAEEKEKKDKKKAAAAVKESPAPAATASESQAVVAETKAKAPATQVDLSNPVASLTIPKLKQFLEENKGEMPGSKAKKAEYVAAAMAVLQSKAKESSIGEALKLLKEK